MEDEKTVDTDEIIEDVVEETTDTEEVTFTQAEVDSQISKAVDSALKKREKAHEKDIQSRINKAVEEAQKRAQMSDDERISAELKEREEAIALREAEAERKEFLADVRTELTRVGLPISMAEMVVNSSTRETADDLITNLKTDWDGAMKESLKSSARQPDPKVPEATPTNNKKPNLANFARENRKVGK